MWKSAKARAAPAGLPVRSREPTRAAAAGATVIMPPWDAFWGDRYGQVVDPFGHVWSMATHIRDVSPAEMEEAMKRECA